MAVTRSQVADKKSNMVVKRFNKAPKKSNAVKKSDKADAKPSTDGKYSSMLTWAILGIFAACIFISFTTQDPRWLHHLKVELFGFLGGVYVLAIILAFSYACCCCFYKVTTCLCIFVFYTLIFLVVGAALVVSSMESA
ncbi:hypothetical protein LIA77_10351 [Sarocladium implicatum]|nr:hypothetical protein LIA77_10351 [Sarocladium implicatum]